MTAEETKEILKKCREARIEKDKKIVQRDWNWHAGRKVENKETARKTNKSYVKWKRMKNKTSNEEVTLKRSEAENPVCSLSSPIDSMVLPQAPLYLQSMTDPLGMIGMLSASSKRWRVPCKSHCYSQTIMSEFCFVTNDYPRGTRQASIINLHFRCNAGCQGP